MQELDFYLDSVSARAVGIILQQPITFTATIPRMTTVHVAGRSGDLHIDLGAYENKTGIAKCYALSENVMSQMSDISAFLFKKGKRKLQTDNDSEHYWEATITNGAELAPRLSLLNPFSIEFSCDPYRRLRIGDDEIHIQKDDVIYNPTGYDAEPKIHFSALGAGEITVNDYKIEITGVVPDYMICDSELWAVYSENAENPYNYNENIKIAAYPKLKPGKNIISWDGNVEVTKIVPRWRTI